MRSQVRVLSGAIRNPCCGVSYANLARWCGTSVGRFQVSVKGHQVTVKLNDQVVNEVDLSQKLADRLKSGSIGALCDMKSIVNAASVVSLASHDLGELLGVIVAHLPFEPERPILFCHADRSQVGVGTAVQPPLNVVRDGRDSDRERS